MNTAQLIFVALGLALLTMLIIGAWDNRRILIRALLRGDRGPAR